MKTEKFVLKTRISEEILAGLAITMADKKVEFNTKKLELSNIRGRYNKEIIALDEEITELADQVHTKHHTETLDCQLNPLPASKRMELLHPNTGEVVHTRPMTTDEAKEGYLFAGINDPEESKSNAKAFLKKKDKGDDVDSVDPEWHETAAELDSHKDTEPEPVGEIETDGEEFPKKAIKEVSIDFAADLDFGAVIKVAQDDGDGFHHGWRIASKRSPKASHATKVLVDGVTFTDYNAMLESAAAAMISRLTSDPKFTTMGVDRTRKITDAIQAFCLPENAESAVSH